MLLQLLFLTLAAAQQPNRTEIKRLYNDGGGCNEVGNITLCGDGTSWNSTMCSIDADLCGDGTSWNGTMCSVDADLCGDGTLWDSANGMCSADVWVCYGNGIDESTVMVMVKDINSGSSGSLPSELTAVGNTLYFTADDGINGTELWKSDGTADGTVMVKDLNAIFDDESGMPGTTQLTAFGNTLYFTSNTGTNGTELWKSDGTSSGTVMVKDINSGSGSSSPYSLTAVGNTLYFQANNGTSGHELWKSDGTDSGTVMVKDINSGSGDSSPYSFTAVGNTLYFPAYDGINGRELWKSDGTDSGTVRVKDINSGSGSSSPYSITAVGDTLYFAANNGTSGHELWKSSAGAVRTELWKSNGTAAGDTVSVTEIELTEIVCERHSG